MRQLYYNSIFWLQSTLLWFSNLLLTASRVYVCAATPCCCRVYFTAQASHLSHLAAKLGAAVDEAMSIPDQQRVAMIGEALARRFPSDAMMSKYRDVWQQVRLLLE